MGAVVTIKASGTTGVERFTPTKRKTKTGFARRTYVPPEPPTLFNFDNLVETFTEEVIKYFEDYGSLPLPNGIDTQEYWTGTAKGATEYTARVRMAAIEDNIPYYLDAANGSDIPIKESLRNKINRTVVPQLSELCPALSK